MNNNNRRIDRYIYQTFYQITNNMIIDERGTMLMLTVYRKIQLLGISQLGTMSHIYENRHIYNNKIKLE